MKIRLLILTIVAMLCVAPGLNGQTLFTSRDTISLSQDSVVLKLENFRGQIQWQFSKDSESWFDIENARSDSLLIDSIDFSCFYRAKIVEGNCNPVYSDTTYVLRKLTDNELQEMITQNDSVRKDVAYYAPDSSNTVITVIDTTGLYQKVEISTTAEIDTIKPGWLLVDTAGLGQIILVTDYRIQKSSTGIIQRFIDGIQVGIDWLVTDQELSYSSPANRTKGWWDNPLKLNNTGEIKESDFMSYVENVVETLEEDYFKLDFSNTELWNIEDDGSHFTVSIAEGYLKYNPSIDFYAIYNPAAIATASLMAVNSIPAVVSGYDYILKGILDELRIITYNDLDFKLKLDIDAGFQKSLEIKPKKLAHFWYTIPAGPVIISIKVDLIARMTVEASGNLNIQPEYELQNNLVLGIHAVEENDGFNKELLFGHHYVENTMVPFEGNFNFKERFEIVPSFEVYVYGLIGLNGELIPYQKFDFNASISDQHPLIYDCSFDLGVDGHGSLDLSAFHFDKATIELFKRDFEIIKPFNLYHAPSRLLSYSGDNQSSPENTTLPDPLLTQVFDSKGNPLNNFPVFYEVVSGGGSIANRTPLTNSSGISGTEWTLGSNDPQKVRAWLTKADISQTVAEVEFNALIDNSGPPVVLTLDADIVTQSSATLNGNLSEDGGKEITEMGFYVSSTVYPPGPATGGTKLVVNTTLGSFNWALSGLQPSTDYHYVAFATNSHGTSVGEVKSFTTSPNTDPMGTFTDSRDGKEYNWVQIGEQTWMAENLAFDAGAGSWAFNNEESNVALYGRIYDWTTSLSACPAGWHLPSFEEWNILAAYISSDKGPYVNDGDQWEFVGGHLKSTTGWKNNGNGTDDYGFNGIPVMGIGFFEGEYAGWWSSDETSVGGASAFHRFLYFEHGTFRFTNHPKEFGYSVRCIKN